MQKSPGHKHLFSGSAVYLASNILSAAVPFALLPVLTRYMRPEEYGQVAMFQVLVSALGAFVGLNTQGAANRKWYDAGLGRQEMGDFIGACMQILLASVAVLLMLMPFRETLAQWLGIDGKWIPWAVAASAAAFVTNVRLGQWQVQGHAVRYGTLQVALALANVLLSLLLVVVLLKGAAGRISAQVLTAFCFGIVALLLLSRDHLLRVSWRPDLWREALGFGVPLIPHIAGLFLLKSVDRAVINDVIGLGAAGIYMVAVQLSLAMAIVFDAINKAYVPWLFERLQRDDAQEKMQVVRLTYVAFAAALAAAGLAFAVGPWLVVVVAGKEYAAAGQVIGWLALGQAFGGMYLMVTNYIFYSRRTGMLSLVTIGTGLLNLALLFGMVEWLGLVGAALAFAGSMALRFVLVWAVAQKRHPMPWRLREAAVEATLD